MSNIFGNRTGLKPSQLKKLQYIYRRRVDHDQICSWEVLKYICDISREIKRQIGLLINRKGGIDYVIVGDHRSILFPELDRARTGYGRLRGLRYVHTHLKNESLSEEDITDLSLLRLDYMLAVTVREDGFPGQLYCAHLLPPTNGHINPVNRFTLNDFNNLENTFLEFISGLEDELQRSTEKIAPQNGKDNAMIVCCSQRSNAYLDESIEETKELANTCDVNIVDTFIQYRNKPDPKYLIGKGKLKELILKSMQFNCNLLIFNQNLNPSLARRISDFTGLKIIDRTQLILDVFAQRANSRDGKVQVELAQLKYILPRLVEKDTMLSRLTGGIGGRGPGETKLEIHRRRAEERITGLEREIDNLSKKRFQKRRMRNRANLPIISIVGYTNAGKSTLLNNLTKSSVIAENRPFSTLDPASRRLRFPKEREVIITDTVGFIRDLPSDLINAFRATLEEIGDADLILHIIDSSNPNFRAHVESVESILKELNYHAIPRIKVFNKIDRIEEERIANLYSIENSVCLSAINTNSFTDLMLKMHSHLWPVNNSSN